MEDHDGLVFGLSYLDHVARFKSPKVLGCVLEQDPFIFQGPNITEKLLTRTLSHRTKKRAS